MSISDKEIEQLAELSKLNFTDEEKESIKNDLNNMLGMMNKLQELDIEKVDPLLHMASGQNIMRADGVENELTNAEALQNAPGVKGAFFTVPKVVKK